METYYILVITHWQFTIANCYMRCMHDIVKKGLENKNS